MLVTDVVLAAVKIQDKPEWSLCTVYTVHITAGQLVNATFNCNCNTIGR